MSIINFFGKRIKPVKLRGTGVLHPTPTSILDEHLSCIQQYDVNLWFYRKGDTVIAFDAGCDEFPNLEREFRKIELDPKEVRAVFITHADMDHAGGLSDGVEPIYPNAKVYLHEKEVAIWTGKTKRFVFGPIAFKNPIERKNDFMTLKDKEILHIGEIKIEVIHTPGHTPGHCCYLVDDKVLISGDSIAFNERGGHCFFGLFNMDTKRNLLSLQKLKRRFKESPPRIICTGHSGYATDSKSFFKHVDQVAKGTKRKPFDKNAPYDVFT